MAAAVSRRNRAGRHRAFPLFIRAQKKSSMSEKLGAERLMPEPWTGRCCINQGRGEAVLTFTRNDMAVTL